MKKIFLVILILFNQLSVFAGSEFLAMSKREYDELLIEGFFVDEIENNDSNIEKPLPQKNTNKEKDAIYFDDKPIELHIKKNDNISPYKETYKKESAQNEFYKSGKFTIFSNSTLELNKYMHNDFKSSMNASYKLNDIINLNAGHEVYYVNQDATIGDRKFYFNPKLNVADNLYFGYTGKYNEINKNIEQEVGINYKPKIFKDSASFGVSAGTTTNEQKDIHSNKLKFTTDFYLF